MSPTPQTLPSTRPDTGVRPGTDHRPVLDDGDHDRFAHYVPKSELMKAYVDGQAITALCGKKWVPSRDPERYPICPTCKEIRGAMLSGD
jgi:hypothetical protein